MSGADSRLMVRAVATLADKGQRPLQEDYSLEYRDKGIFIVSDGFGGPVGGVQASKTACEAIREFLVKEAGDLDATLPFVLRSYFSLAGNVLFNALVHANNKVLASNFEKGIHERGGASVIAGFIDGNLLALGNVGGCSAWLFRGAKATELVMPRTYGRLLDPQTPAGTPRDPAFQIPLMAVGMVEDLEPEIFEYRLQPGDWILFQTDGVDPRIVQRLTELRAQAPTGQQIAESLSEFQPEENATAMVICF